MPNRPPVDDPHHYDTTSGHSRRLRAALRAAREAQQISAEEVCRRIARVMTEQARARDPRAKAVTPPHVNTLYSWERFVRHPGIDSMAAWARVLGYRLVVDLTDAVEPRTPILLEHPETVRIARAVDSWPDRRRRALLAVIESEEE